MTWALDWSAVAERDLLALPWRLAARIDAAVMAFAADRAGEGVVERISAHDPRRLRLRLYGASAFLWVDPEAGIVHVARVLRNT
jgi:hypothetical protein